MTAEETGELFGNILIVQLMVLTVLFRNSVWLNPDDKRFITTDKTASYIGGAGGDGDAGEIFTERKGIAAEPFHGVGDNDFFQVLKRCCPA